MYQHATQCQRSRKHLTLVTILFLTPYSSQSSIIEDRYFLIVFPSVRSRSLVERSWQSLTVLLCLACEHVALKGKQWAGFTKVTPELPLQPRVSRARSPTPHSRRGVTPLFVYTSVASFCFPSTLFVHRAHPVPLPFFFYLLFSFNSSLTTRSEWFLPFSARRASPIVILPSGMRESKGGGVHAHVCGNASRNAGQRSYGTTSQRGWLPSVWRILHDVPVQKFLP